MIGSCPIAGSTNPLIDGAFRTSPHRGTPSEGLQCYYVLLRAFPRRFARHFCPNRRGQAVGAKAVLVTVQAKPLYVDGMHAGRGRRQTLPFEEFVQALDAVRSSGADGVTIFTWSDLLRQALAEK